MHVLQELFALLCSSRARHKRSSFTFNALHVQIFQSIAFIIQTELLYPLLGKSSLQENETHNLAPIRHRSRDRSSDRQLLPAEAVLPSERCEQFVDVEERLMLQ